MYSSLDLSAHKKQQRVLHENPVQRVTRGSSGWTAANISWRNCRFFRAKSPPSSHRGKKQDIPPPISVRSIGKEVRLSGSCCHRGRSLCLQRHVESEACLGCYCVRGGGDERVLGSSWRLWRWRGQTEGRAHSSAVATGHLRGASRLHASA